MIGIIIATHGRFSEEIVRSAELIAGPAKNVKALTLERADNIEDFNDRFVKSIKELDEGDGILVFTDLLGGSPCNVSNMNMKRYKFQAITGVNFPMLMEAIMLRENDITIEELAEKCLKMGKEGIIHLNKMLK
jgi:PTS system mannose-specific IIA component